MKTILYRVDATGRNAGLKLNAKKTKVMHVHKKEEAPKIKVDNVELEYERSFKYLGSVKEENGDCS